MAAMDTPSCPTTEKGEEATQHGKSTDEPPQEEPLAYQLKWVPWKEGFVPIVTQNKNGPCPLLALCNALIFKGRLRVEPGQTFILSQDLMQLLADQILERPPHHISEAEKVNYEQALQDALLIFPKLQTGIDVNVTFNRVDGFEFTPEVGLFDLVGVSLYHGWLADPQQRETHQVVAQTSYNQLVSMAIGGAEETDQDGGSSEYQAKVMVAREFLESTAAQLTHYGLSVLVESVREGDYVVVFRNNHFTMCHKRERVLYELITDLGYLNEHGHVWQSLDDVSGNGDYFDSQFRCRSKTEVELDPSTTQLDHELALGLQTQEAGDVDSYNPLQPTGEPPSTTTEMASQQDQDLALAYELQQEYDMEQQQQQQQQVASEQQRGTTTHTHQQVRQDGRQQAAHQSTDSDCAIL